MNLEFSFIRETDEEWKLFGIDVSETEEHLTNRVIMDMFLKYKIVDHILGLLKEKDNMDFKTAIVTVPYPIEDRSTMSIAYFPLEIGGVYGEKIKECQD